jgi:hypothetical protein
MSEGKKPNDEEEKSNLVITPGGPRPKEQVYSVRPGEVVSVDDEGHAHVIPLDEASPKGEVRSTDMSEDLVLTPGGYRPKSLVHLVKPGHSVDVAGSQLQLVNMETMASIDIPKVTFDADELAALNSTGGWIADASWANDTGSPITSFLATWVVPEAPSTNSGQLIYLFSGIDPANTSAAILQPVLQWGFSEAGGGPYWSVASWYVLGSGQAFHTSSVQVNAGDTLTGAMTLTDNTGGGFTYNCEFVGIANTSLVVAAPAELVWCNVTLEAYNVTQCSDYPASASTAFQSIEIQTGDTTPPVNWSVDNIVTDCGQQAVVVNNSGANGEIDIFYS